jgi:Ser/Thr protein kinase RdoA (MazF antagonist)
MALKLINQTNIRPCAKRMIPFIHPFRLQAPDRRLEPAAPVSDTLQENSAQTQSKIAHPMFQPTPDQESDHPFAELTPDRIQDAVETIGMLGDGRLLALNSYENRVWQVGLETGDPIIVKFYRPGRWSDEAIIEEHRFSLELAGAGLSVVAPLAMDGTTLFHHGIYRFAVFPRQGGHAPELSHQPTLVALGRALGRLHAVGATASFRFRQSCSIRLWGHEPVQWLLDNQWLPAHLETAFAGLCEHLLEAVEATWVRAGDFRTIRLHGDCHPGNILWRDEQAHFVDLDDCLTGPAIQDLWMLISGERHDREQQLGWLLQDYRIFKDFDARELHLIEPLRTLRMLHHQAWLARRWSDPAFPRAFPWFGEGRHWENLIGQLREQLDQLQQPPLELPLS